MHQGERKEGGDNIAKRWLRMLRALKVRRAEGGHNTTTIRHNNDKNEHRTHK